MSDFSLKTYSTLIEALLKQDFEFFRFQDFYNIDNLKRIVLRHDVDARKENSLLFAKIQNKIGVVGTYYFRIVPESFDEKIIREIAALGHEIGYHYENMDTCHGNIDKAYDEFCKNLEILRKIYPVKTICMHGSPLSKFDNREIWRKYDYHNLGIIGEPYFDINFDEVLYLTDTGRRWNGDSYNIRDKAVGSRRKAVGERDFETKGRRGEETIVSPSIKSSLQPSALSPQPFSRTPNDSKPVPSNQQPATFSKFHSTFDIIRTAERGELPAKIMMTFHPQRWTDKPGPWVKELVWQNVKNVGKFFLVRIR